MWASATARVQPDSLSERIGRLSSADEMYDEDEPRPTPAAIDYATRLIRECRSVIARLGFEDADVHAASGAVRIVWAHGPRTLKLVVPPNLNAYIFHMEGEDSAISEEVTADALHDWLEWLSTGVHASSFSLHHA